MCACVSVKLDHFTLEPNPTFWFWFGLVWFGVVLDGLGSSVSHLPHPHQAFRTHVRRSDRATPRHAFSANVTPSPHLALRCDSHWGPFPSPPPAENLPGLQAAAQGRLRGKFPHCLWPLLPVSLPRESMTLVHGRCSPYI